MSENKQLTPAQKTRDFLNSPKIKEKMSELLGKRAVGFTTGVLQVVNNNKLLQNASVETIYSAAMTAAILDLPINNNLGYAWIVPYKGQAQFQIGWRGIVQLAQRSGQYLKINCIPVYANQFISYNSLTEELKGDFDLPQQGDVVGYCGYFKLVNGFEKTIYWSKDQVLAHAKRFSKSFGSGPWQTDFDAMAMKTVLKSLISKWGPMSVDVQMQMAIKADQAVVQDVTEDTVDVEYTDATTQEEQFEQAVDDQKKEMRENGQTQIPMP